jgi:hypothetical protein
MELPGAKIFCGAPACCQGLPCASESSKRGLCFRCCTESFANPDVLALVVAPCGLPTHSCSVVEALWKRVVAGERNCAILQVAGFVGKIAEITFSIIAFVCAAPQRVYRCILLLSFMWQHRKPILNIQAILEHHFQDAIALYSDRSVLRVSSHACSATWWQRRSLVYLCLRHLRQLGRAAHPVDLTPAACALV